MQLIFLTDLEPENFTNKTKWWKFLKMLPDVQMQLPVFLFQYSYNWRLFNSNLICFINPTFYRGGGGIRFWSLGPPEWSEGPQMMAQFKYNSENWFPENKFKIFKKFLKFFFRFLDTLHTQKDFWVKNNLLIFIHSEGKMSIWPPKNAF